ncbi:MAG TPA: alpha/beta hydrolase [Candidatus Saccharimonadales bacterium]|jgi:monoterpene epsilon-lactone hydrolase|nr:alpha/beta hydrolase [Candidatus Saccharimonadales bacterium]
MASWQAHCISFLIRHTFKPRLSRSRDAQEARAVMSGGAFPTPRGVRITQVTLGGISCECVEAEAGSPAGILFFLHGGGYFACSPQSHRSYTTFFAQRGFKVIAPAYRLAPENPFPAGLDDAVAAWRALRTQTGGATPIVIAGDSAGGGLALATMFKLRDAGDRLPAAAILFSPLTDLAGTGNSIVANGKRCAMFYSESLARATAFYVPNGDLRNPLASPLYADLHGLPPLFIHVGADETLLDDSTRFAERARAAGVAVEFKIWPAVPHDWHLFRKFVPEGGQSLEQAAEFLVKTIGATGAAAKEVATAR